MQKLPKNITKKLYVTYGVASYNEGDINVSNFPVYVDPNGTPPSSVIICETEITVELPSDFNPTENMISVLEKSKESVKEEFGKKLATIDQKIQELRALPAPEAAQ